MKEKLFSEFQAPTTQEWLDKIEVDLKGADFQKKLVWRTNEGFNVQPFYRREDLKDLKAVDSLPGEFPFIRGNKKDNNLWFVRQDIDVECPKAANEKALDILNKGVDSLGFKISGKDLSKEFIATLLDGILPQYVELNFKTCQRHCVELAQILVEYFKEKNYPLADLKGSINFDPISKILCMGKDVSALLECAKPLIEALAELPGYKCINVNSVALNNAGAYIYQELGYALAWGAEYMNILTEAGVEATKAAKRIKFNMGVSDNYFKYIKQEVESDATFLAKIAMLEGAALVIFDGRIIMAKEKDLEAADPVAELDTNGSFIEIFDHSARAFGSALISVGQFKGAYTANNGSSRKLTERPGNLQASSSAECMIYAAGLLRYKNKGLTGLKMTTALSPEIPAGVTCTLGGSSAPSGWTGTLFVHHIRHEFHKNQSTVFLRKPLEGY